MEAVRRRLLLVTPFAPSADGRHGGARAVYGLASELVKRNDVALLHLDREEIDPALAAACVSVHTVAVSDPGPWGVRLRGAALVLRGRSLKAGASSIPQLQRKVRELGRSFAPDVIQVETGVLGDALAAARGSLRVVTIQEPAASLRESLHLRSGGLPFVHHLDAHVALREERRILGRADAAVVFTERDRRQLERHRSIHAEIATIPLGWDVPERSLNPAGTQPPTLLFIGSFTHPPNVDAALTLLRRILPAVRAAHPQVRLELVGDSPPPELLEAAGETISVTGGVPNVSPHLDRAAIVVLPIAIGGGMRVKALEALAAGKVVVASARAVEGISAQPGRDLEVVEDDDEMARTICRLLEDEDARRRMAERARAWAARELSWAAMADHYDELYARLGRRKTRS